MLYELFLTPDFWSGVLASALVAAFGAVLKKFYEWLRLYRQSPYSGKWEDEIYANDQRNDVVKRDTYNIKHNKKDGTLTGTIRRTQPHNQSNRNWNLRGVINKNHIIIVFWTSDPMKKSNGCIYAKHIGDYEYEGYYLEEHDSKIDKTPIKLIKQPTSLKG